MKKIFLYLLSALFIFSGCSFTDSLKSNPDATSYEGILNAQPSDSRGLGTHLLDTEAEDDVILRSLTINLSGAEFLGNNVRLLGEFNESDGVFEVTGVSVLEKLSREDIDVEFIEYKDTDLGFEIKHFSDWGVEDVAGGVEFYAPVIEEADSSDMVSIVRFDFVATYPLDDFDNEVTPLVEFASTAFPLIDAPGSLINKIGPGKLNALKMETDSVDVDYYFFRNNFIYKASFVSSENYMVGNEQVFDEMLAEFRFLGFTIDEDNEVLEEDDKEMEDELASDDELYVPIEESVMFSVPSLGMDLSSFESLTFEFKGEYPANWYYAGSSSSDGNVLRHYGFSDESVTDDNEMIGLDYVRDFPTTGQKVVANGREMYIVKSGSTYMVNVSVGDKKFSVYGDIELENLISVMAANVEPIE